MIDNWRNKKMWKDPIVEEIRKAGAKLAEKCNYDFNKFSKMLKEHQKNSDKVIISKKTLKDKVVTAGK